VRSPYNPPGCYYRRSNNKYWWNYNRKSTAKCTIKNQCICKTKKCIICPINTYSEGGINPTCTPCPKDKPTTNFKTGQTSIDACIAVPSLKCEADYGVIGDGIKIPKTCTKCWNGHSAGGVDVKCACKAGDGFGVVDFFSSGFASQCTGVSKITTEEECRLAAVFNRKHNIVSDDAHRINKGYGGRKSVSWLPPGCYNDIMVIIILMPKQKQQQNVVCRLIVSANQKHVPNAQLIHIVKVVPIQRVHHVQKRDHIRF
jgi:hypothetical protein